jgi:hypothetical protein
VIKVLIFAVLVGVFWGFGGLAIAEDRSMRRFHDTVSLLYLFGAGMALWGGSKPIGTLQPVSLRPIFIACGALLMVLSFAAMLTVRPQKQSSHQSRQPTPGVRLATYRASLAQRGCAHRWARVAI